MEKFIQQIREVIAGLSMIRKISIIAVLVIAVGVMGYLVHLSKQASFEPLFTNLNSEDMGSIISRLDKQGTKYRVDQDQRTVLVPSTEVLTIRLKLAEEGLPRYGGIGFEIFDKTGFGQSDFEQKINFQRALEGELARTIMSLKEVEKARVHLALPEKSLFTESKQSGSASVILKLGNGGVLPMSTVYSITHLVASAVEGLDASQVTVVDSQGHLLTPSGGDSSLAAGGQAFDQKAQIEASYEHRIVEMLTPVVGLGKILARVTAEVDFTHVESTDEIIDPTKTAVVQESRTNSKKSEASGAGEGEAAATASGNNSSANEGSEQINYQVSKSVRHEVKPSGTVKKLSIAILVDGTYVEKDKKQVYTPRPADEVKKIEDLVKNAVGFQTDRGDQMKVENMAFQTPEAQIEASEAWMKKRTTYGFLITILGNVLLVAVIMLVFFFVIRPLVSGWLGVRQGGTSEGGVPLLEGEVATDLGQLVRTNPSAAAEAIRRWLE